jgi:hypothetical protein
MEYICDKIIPITKFENLNIYLETKVVDGKLFYGVWYWYIYIYKLYLGQFRNLKFLDEISFKICVFFAFVC